MALPPRSGPTAPKQPQTSAPPPRHPTPVTLHTHPPNAESAYHPKTPILVPSTRVSYYPLNVRAHTPPPSLPTPCALLPPPPPRLKILQGLSIWPFGPGFLACPALCSRAQGGGARPRRRRACHTLPDFPHKPLCPSPAPTPPPQNVAGHIHVVQLAWFFGAPALCPCAPGGCAERCGLGGRCAGLCIAELRRLQCEHAAQRPPSSSSSSASASATSFFTSGGIIPTHLPRRLAYYLLVLAVGFTNLPVIAEVHCGLKRTHGGDAAAVVQQQRRAAALKSRVAHVRDQEGSFEPRVVLAGALATLSSRNLPRRPLTDGCPFSYSLSAMLLRMCRTCGPSFINKLPWLTGELETCQFTVANWCEAVGLI